METQTATTTAVVVVVGPQQVLIYDTTLRDGTQGESVSASVEDKIKICHRLAAFGVDFIEAGWPGSNPKDAALFARLLHEAQHEQQQQQQEVMATAKYAATSTTTTTTTMARTVFGKLAAFGSTRRKHVAVQDDDQVQALLDSQAPTICIVAKAHAWQVTDILRTTCDENLAMIQDTVQYLVQGGGDSDGGDTTSDNVRRGRPRNVMVDMEHYFDGYWHNPEYAVQCCLTAAQAGASCLVLCDTNGGSMPWQIQDAVTQLLSRLHDQDCHVTLGIHCHNDCGMAVANSIMAIQAGVGLVQGTINGIGERTGNADLCGIVPSLALKLQSQMTCRSQLPQLTKLSRFVDEILNRTPHAAQPYVGASAFAHKGGLHVAAMKRSPDSYQHANPSDVGNESRILISELSGRQNILGKVEALMKKGHISSSSSSSSSNGDAAATAAATLEDSAVLASNRAAAILKRVKQLEAKGYTFEGAEASVDLMILHSSKEYCPPFEVLDYSAQVYDSRMDSASRFFQYDDDDDDDENTMCRATGLGPTARATVKVRTIETRHPDLKDNDNEKEESLAVVHERLEVGDGNGPVDALAQALMRALQPVHPSLAFVELMDYKVRILDPEMATGAATRVLIEFKDVSRETTWTTVSVDTNVISASLNALIDGLEYALLDYHNAQDSCLLSSNNSGE
ncbi:hypothetical protein ACA910_003588 [Epithemia clementina (nom. ined.)]